MTEQTQRRQYTEQLKSEWTLKKLFISQVSTGDSPIVQTAEHQRSEHRIRSGRMPSLKSLTFYKTFHKYFVYCCRCCWCHSYLFTRFLCARERERESFPVVCGVKHVVYSVFPSMETARAERLCCGSSFAKYRLPHHFGNCFVVVRSMKSYASTWKWQINHIARWCHKIHLKMCWNVDEKKIRASDEKQKHDHRKIFSFAGNWSIMTRERENTQKVIKNNRFFSLLHSLCRYVHQCKTWTKNRRTLLGGRTATTMLILSWIIQSLQFILHNSMVLQPEFFVGIKKHVAEKYCGLSTEKFISPLSELLQGKKVFFSADIQQHFNNLKAVWITSVIWKHFNFATWNGILIGLQLTSCVFPFLRTDFPYTYDALRPLVRGCRGLNVAVDCARDKRPRKGGSDGSASHVWIWKRTGINMTRICD